MKMLGFKCQTGSSSSHSRKKAPEHLIGLGNEAVSDGGRLLGGEAGKDAHGGQHLLKAQPSLHPRRQHDAAEGRAVQLPQHALRLCLGY